jgi:hypothetical protein
MGRPLIPFCLFSWVLAGPVCLEGFPEADCLDPVSTKLETTPKAEKSGNASKHRRYLSSVSRSSRKLIMSQKAK